MEFSNKETALMAKWYGNKIEDIVSDNKEMTDINLQALISETIENMIKEEIQPYLSEGYISELVGLSFKKVNYDELIQYYRDEK